MDFLLRFTIRCKKEKFKEKKFNRERISHPSKHYSNELTHLHTEVVPGDELRVLVLLSVALLVSYSTVKKYINLNKIDDVINVHRKKTESQEHLNIFLQAEKCLLTSYILSYLFSWICMNLKQNPCLAFAGLYLNKVYAL